MVGRLIDMRSVAPLLTDAEMAEQCCVTDMMPGTCIACDTERTSRYGTTNRDRETMGSSLIAAALQQCRYMANEEKTRKQRLQSVMRLELRRWGQGKTVEKNVALACGFMQAVAEAGIWGEWGV